jgi:hypothetical protein
MPRFLIDKILPANEVHIIAGPSGSGKTTWALQTFVLDWQHGRDVLGFRSFPVPWMYVSSDRSLKSVHATMERLKIPQDAVRTASAVDAGLHDMGKLLKVSNSLVPRPEFLYIDGMLNLLPDNVHPNDNKAVCKWLADQTRMCDREGLTIMGSLHSPKMKKDEWYDNPRQRISGGASWAGFADTIILIEPTSPDDPQAEHQRRLLVLPRNYSSISVDLVFNSEGRLIEQDRELAEGLLFAFLEAMKPDTAFTTEQVLDALGDKVSRRTIFNWLDKAAADGAIIRVCKGRYRRLRKM